MTTPRASRRLLTTALRVLISVALLGLTLWIVDLEQVAEALTRAQWIPAIIALALSIPLVLVLAWRWSFTAKRLGVRLPLSVAVREYYGSLFLNQVLPGGVLGDVGRVVRGGMRTPQQRSAVARAVILERLSGQIALWLILLTSLLVTDTLPPWITLLVGLVLLGIVGLAHATSKLDTVRETWLGRTIQRARDDLGSAFVQRGAWALQLGLSMASIALLGATFAACTSAVNASAHPMQLLLIAPAVLAVTSLPATAGGWGLREGASAMLFDFVGLDAATGVAASALYGVIGLLGTLPGAALLTMPAKENNVA